MINLYSVSYTHLNVFIAASGVLLMVSTLNELGYHTTPLEVSKGSIPIAFVATIFAIIQFLMFDKKLDKRFEARKMEKSKN